MTVFSKLIKTKSSLTCNTRHYMDIGRSKTTFGLETDKKKKTGWESVISNFINSFQDITFKTELIPEYTLCMTFTRNLVYLILDRHMS